MNRQLKLPFPDLEPGISGNYFSILHKAGYIADTKSKFYKTNKFHITVTAGNDERYGPRLNSYLGWNQGQKLYILCPGHWERTPSCVVEFSGRKILRFKCYCCSLSGGGRRLGHLIAESEIYPKKDLLYGVLRGKIQASAKP